MRARETAPTPKVEGLCVWLDMDQSAQMPSAPAPTTPTYASGSACYLPPTRCPVSIRPREAKMPFAFPIRPAHPLPEPIHPESVWRGVGEEVLGNAGLDQLPVVIHLDHLHKGLDGPVTEHLPHQHPQRDHQEPHECQGHDLPLPGVVLCGAVPALNFPVHLVNALPFVGHPQPRRQ